MLTEFQLLLFGFRSFGRARTRCGAPTKHTPPTTSCDLGKQLREDTLHFTSEPARVSRCSSQPARQVCPRRMIAGAFSRAKRMTHNDVPDRIGRPEEDTLHFAVSVRLLGRFGTPRHGRRSNVVSQSLGPQTKRKTSRTMRRYVTRYFCTSSPPDVQMNDAVVWWVSPTMLVTLNSGQRSGRVGQSMP